MLVSGQREHGGLSMEFKGFSDEELMFLTKQEKQEVLQLMEEISVSRSTLYIGKRLVQLRDILVPFGYFARCLEALGVVLRTAYGYMYGYRNAMSQLPEGAVNAMMDRKLVIVSARHSPSLGIYTGAIGKVPPPKTGTAATYSKWVDEMLAAKGPRMRSQVANRTPRDPESILADCYRFIAKQARRLPAQTKTRSAFAKRLMGLMLTHFNLPQQEISPIKIQDSFNDPQTRYLVAKVISRNESVA